MHSKISSLQYFVFLEKLSFRFKFYFEIQNYNFLFLVVRPLSDWLSHLSPLIGHTDRLSLLAGQRSSQHGVSAPGQTRWGAARVPTRQARAPAGSPLTRQRGVRPAESATQTHPAEHRCRKLPTTSREVQVGTQARTNRRDIWGGELYCNHEGWEK